MNIIFDKLQEIVRGITRRFGVDVVRFSLTELEEHDREIYMKVAPYTMTSLERVMTVIESVEYLVTNNIKGPLVECGVWRGGSIMAAALKLIQMGDVGRDLYLLDTFEGMIEPSKKDVSYSGVSAQGEFSKVKINKNSSTWCYASLSEVKANLYSTGYPKDKIHFIKGKVEDTLKKKKLSDSFAWVRIDTDWYASTKHCMNVLYPDLVRGGVLILDDYGFWKGARQAILEYLKETKTKIFLSRIDHTGRIGIKP